MHTTKRMYLIINNERLKSLKINSSKQDRVLKKLLHLLKEQEQHEELNV